MKVFVDFAEKYNLDVVDQRSVLLGFIEDHSRMAEFTEFLDAFGKELTAPDIALAPHTVESAPEDEVFFDRSLARASLQRLVSLPTDGTTTAQPGYVSARLLVPPREYDRLVEILENGETFLNSREGEIICGWYHVFNDGSTAAMAVTNADDADGGAFIDAFLILPEGVHVTAPNPTLPPRRRLDEDFVFNYPDGTYRIIRLEKPTAQQ